MLYLASFQKLKSNTSNSVRLLTCYYTPYKLSIFKISPMSEYFKVPPYKALLLSWTTCVTVLNLVRRQQQPLFLGWVTPTGYYEDDHACITEGWSSTQHWRNASTHTTQHDYDLPFKSQIFKIVLEISSWSHFFLKFYTEYIFQSMYTCKINI